MAEKKETEKEKRLHVEIVRQMLTLATSGFALVAALAWNSLIQTTIEEYIQTYFPESSGILSLLVYALVVTVVAVFVTLQLSRLLKRIEEE